MRRFKLCRLQDETGVSGTGHVAEGVELTNGRAVLSWLTDVASVALYDSIDDLEYIHGHHGKTVIQWLD